LKDISVVLPCYNREKTIENEVLEVYTCLTGLKSIGDIEGFEVVVVDDGSEDGTLSSLKKLKKAMPFLTILTYGKNMGKGHAVKAGVLLSKGAVVCFMDADLSAPPSELRRFMYLLNSLDSGVVIGSRAGEGSLVNVPQPIHRRIMGRIFSLISSKIVPLGGISDTQCGFKMFKREEANLLFSKQKADGFSFDVEILHMARKSNIPIIEVPVVWSDKPGSSVRPFRDAFSMLLDLLKIRFLWGR